MRCLLRQLLVIAVFSACTRSSEPEIARAESAFKARDYDQAIDITQSLLRENPKGTDAHRLKILSHVARGETDKAIDQYDLALENGTSVQPLLGQMCLLIVQTAFTHENFFVRSAAAKTIGEMGDPAQIRSVASLLRDDNAFVRLFVVETLGRLGGDDALKMLMAAGRDPDVMVRIGAVKAVDDMTKGKPGSEKLFALFEADKTPAVQLFRLSALAQRGDQTALTRIVTMMETLSADEKPAGLSALGRTRDARAIAFLMPFLKDADPTMRMYAALAAGDIASPSSLDALIPLLLDSETMVRGSAATALGKLGDRKAIPLLTKQIEDPDPVVRASVAEALQRLGQTYQDHKRIYETALAEEDYGVRHFAIGSLAQTAGRDALPIFIKALSDTAQRVRIAAVRAIGETGAASEIPILKEALRDPDPSVRTYAAGNIIRILTRR